MGSDIDPDLAVILTAARETLVDRAADIPAPWCARLVVDLADPPPAGSARSRALVRDIWDLDRLLCRKLRERGEWP